MKTHSLHNYSLIRKLRLSLFVVLFTLFTTSSFSQAYKNNWYFGDLNALNFSSSFPVPVTGSQIMGFNHSTTMSDDFGNLLFYSDSKTIWNANNVPIPLVGGFLEGSDNSNQGVSFKNPANQNQYYYFYINPMTAPELKLGQLFYSIIDASTPLVTITPFEDIQVNCLGCNGDEFAEAITAIPHCNGIDYWVIVHGSFELVVYLVNANGVTQSGVFPSDAIDAIGTLKSSPDGSKLALGTVASGFLGTGRLIMYDFNSTTGAINNENILSTEQHLGISFSPNSQILYAINYDYSITHPNQSGLEVYDLTNTLPNYIIPVSSSSFYMQLANNGQIYINKELNLFLGAITDPNNFLDPKPIENAVVTTNIQQHSITTFIDAIQPPIPTDFIANVGACGLVNVDINPCWAGYNVSWNFGDGGTSTSATATHTYATAGSFTITLTVSLGSVSQTFTQEVTVNTCCTSPLGSSTVPVAGASSTGYPFGLLGSTIAINGNFTINTNFTINNKTLLMAPNTKIIVTAGNTLTISKSTLYSCGTQMWDGIEIQPGGNLVLLKGTWIEDAKIAVLSDNNGGIANFDISNTTFNRNYIGVKVENYTSSTLHPGIISRTTFDSRNSITSTVNTPLLDSPYDTQPAEIGVYLYVVNNVRVGVTTNPAAKNNFRYLKTGIYGIAAEYEVYNNDFRNNVPNGWAIVNTKSSKMIAGGNLANQPNNFQNISNGISHTSSSDLSVTDNTFTNINPQGFLFDPSTAIYTFECNNATIELSKNQLNNVVNGFYHLKNSYTTYYVAYNTFNTFTGKAVACIENNKGSIDVFQNQFTGVQSLFYSGNTAVYVAGTAITFPTSAVVTINENNISKINKGIHVIGVGRPIIEKNNITFNANIFPTLLEFYFGIRTQNNAREEIHLNHVDKIGANPSAAVVNALYGVSVETSSGNPYVSENTVKKMGNGFRFRFFYDGADFRCNTMTNNWFGLTIDNAKIGDQGAAPSAAQPNGLASDNYWTDPSIIGSPTAVKGLGTIYSPAFYTRSAGYGFTPINTHISPLSTIQTVGGLPISLPGSYLTSADKLCQTICYDPATCKIPKLAKIARNETPYDQILGNERFLMHEAVLKSV